MPPMMMMMLQGLKMVDRKKTTQEKSIRSSDPYSSKIIKAGALIGDTKTLLSHWDVASSVDENVNSAQRDIPLLLEVISDRTPRRRNRRRDFAISLVFGASL